MPLEKVVIMEKGVCILLFFLNFPLNWGQSFVISIVVWEKGAKGRGERDYFHLPLHLFLSLVEYKLNIINS